MIFGLFTVIFGLFKSLAKLFRRNAPETPQAQLSSVGDEAWSHQRVRDLTGQLFNIPQYPTESGGYGDVWKCDWIKDGIIVKVAAKAIRRQSESDGDAFRERGKQELEVWMRLRHERVLPLYGVAYEFRGTSAMVSPWLENGTVTSFIDSHRNLSGSHRLQLISDVAAGLRYIHSQSIVHGDLSGSNILVCAQGRAYIADFGHSFILVENGTVSHALTEAARWAAPELILITSPDSEDIRDLLSWQSDMYSFGSIMFHILSGITPYHELLYNQVIAAIIEGEKPHRPEEPQISDRNWDFIQRCWLPSERKSCRPSADEAYNFLLDGSQLISL